MTPKLKRVIDSEKSGCIGCYFNRRSNGNRWCMRPDDPEYKDQSCIVQSTYGVHAAIFVVDNEPTGES